MKERAVFAYRPEIDGLRAIAVSVVVFYHSGFGALSGGFIGVDIFFVISGFLITSLLVRELDSGDFSLAGFYAKRIRRLYPALVLTIILSLAIGYLIFMPDEFKELGQSAVGVVTYLANLFFLLKSDYFDGPSELKPLLHTWSLAVEEQFYIVYPLVLMLVYSFLRKHRTLVIVSILLISFLLCLYFIDIDSSTTFFLTPFRAWEFLIGALCASFTHRKYRILNREFFSLIGFVLIFLSLVLVDESTRFPGLAAVPVCIGSALVIALNNQETLSGRLLSSKPMVFLGRISYSVYLVHWPLIVYYKYYMIRDLYLVEKILLVFLSFFLGFLVYRLVENRFRVSSIDSAGVRSTFIYTAGLTCLISVIGVVTHVNEGFKNRFKVDHIVIEPKEYRSVEVGNCFLTTDESFSDWEGEECFLGGRKDNVGTTLLWGDSHANHLIYGLNENSGNIKNNVLVYASAGCAPIFSISISGRPNCKKNNSNVLDVIKSFDVRHVVLVSNWNGAVRQGVNLKALSGTLEQLKSLNLQVSVINQLPIYSIFNPGYLIYRLSSGEQYNGDYFIAPGQGFNESIQIQKIAEKSKVEVFNGIDVFCKDGQCGIIKSGNLTVVDHGHLSKFGSQYFISELLKKLPDFFG